MMIDEGVRSKMETSQVDSKMASEIVKKDRGFWSLRSVRFQLGLLLCVNCFVLAYARHSLGMAMVCMVNETGVIDGVATTVNRSSQENDTTCPITSQIRTDYEGEFSWTTAQQGSLFSALYWGSLLVLIPAGYLSDRYSPGRLLTSALLINAIGAALTPPAAIYGGYEALFAVRFFMGVGQGLSMPAVSSLVARWYPGAERATVISLYSAGNQVAGIIGTPLNAWFCHLGVGNRGSPVLGWPLIFAAAAVLASITLVGWALLVNDRPEKSRRMRDGERSFLARAILDASKKNDDGKNGGGRFRNVPLRSLMASRPIWACVLCNLADGFLTAVLSSYLPTYFMEVLRLGLYANGIYNAAPQLVQMGAKFVMAAGAERIKRSGRVSETSICKLFNTIGFIGPAVFIVACSFLSCAQGTLAVVFLCTALGLFAGATPGFMTSQLALAPRYAGIVSALTMATFQIGSIVAPYIVGAMTAEGTRQEWQIVFATVAVTLVVAGLVFLVFGSADAQPWAKPKKDSVQTTIPPIALRQISIPDVAVVAVLADQMINIMQAAAGGSMDERTSSMMIRNPDLVPESDSFNSEVVSRI